jgi:hypothetical protein
MRFAGGDSVRIIVRLSMTLVALAAAALSYQSLMRLGELCGYGSLPWLYPLVVDLGAAASCAAWLHARSRQALGMTWSLLAISVVLNGTVHYLTATGIAPSWLLVVAVAAVPPTVLGLCVHLVVGLGAPDVPMSDTYGHDDLAGVEPGSGPDVPEGLGRRRLAAEPGVSEYAARRILAERNGAAT